MADNTFKNSNIHFPLGWTPHSHGEIIGNYKYRPDRSFQDEAGRVVCIAESSSTNDRKVNVGELLLADLFFTDNRVPGVLIISLCGRSRYPPSPDSQAKYLKPYFEYLKTLNPNSGLKELYIISESDFESLSWYALSEEFVALSQRLWVPDADAKPEA